MGKDKPQMAKEQTDALLASANALRTGEKLSPALIVIIAISVLGLVVYVYTAISSFGTRALISYFPLVMYVLMYISIIRYVVDYFAKGKDASIDGMLMRYCALTAATIITSGEGLLHEILIINVMILVLVPLMREDLTNVKKSTAIAIIVAVLCVAAAVVRLVASAATFGTLSGLALVASVFDALNPTVQWLLFVALYLIRCKKGKELIEQVLVQKAA